MTESDVGATAPAAEAAPEERRLAGSPHAVAANAAMLALTRAARSFTLYDPANKVVRTLIADYRDKLEKALASFGPLRLAVHPFELLLDREVVYVEKDRERSLAFRLFRDGVRTIAFEPGATWVELLRLLQVLSIRYSGVRQQEDDLVTLLRKADFVHVSIRAIEGFVPEEEDAEPPLGGGPGRALLERHEPPVDWDLPLPPFRDTATLRYHSVPLACLEELRVEESPDSVPLAAMHAVAEVLQAPGQPDTQAALAFALEVREFLLIEQRFDLVVELAVLVVKALTATSQGTGGFLGSYLDPATLRVLLLGSRSEAMPSPALLQLLEMAPIETQSALLDLLTSASDSSQAATLRTVVARGFRQAPEELAARFEAAQGPAALALYRLLADVDAGAALRCAERAAQAPEPELQMEALRQLASVPIGLETARTLRKLLDSRFAEVRLATLPLMPGGGERAFPVLRAYVERRSATFADAEAETAGRALAEASPRSALELFNGWLAVRGAGWFGRLGRIQSSPKLQLVALAGLRVVGGSQAGGLLELLANQGHASVASSAAAALQARPVAGGRHA